MTVPGLELVWCWDEHDWLDITSAGDDELHSLCARCSATARRPLPEVTR